MNLGRLAYVNCKAAPAHTKYSLGVNGCNLLLIDFLSPLSRRSVREVQSPALHWSQQTVPVSWTCRHQLAGCAGWICFHTGLHNNGVLLLMRLNQMSSSALTQSLTSVTFFFPEGFVFVRLFLFHFRLSCIQSILFHQNPHNGFP